MVEEQAGPQEALTLAQLALLRQLVEDKEEEEVAHRMVAQQGQVGPVALRVVAVAVAVLWMVQVQAAQAGPEAGVKCGSGSSDRCLDYGSGP